MPWRAVVAVIPLACSAFATLPPARAERPLDDVFLAQYAETYRFSLGTPQAIHVLDGSKAVLFLRSGPRSFVRDLFEVDLTTGHERLLLTAERLLAGQEEHLSADERARRERMRLAARGIASYDVSRDGNRVLVPISGRLFVIERNTDAIKEMPGGQGFPLDPRFSPDGRQVAVVRNGDLHVIEVATGTARRVTTGATGTLTHGLAEFVAQEEMGRSEGYWWSPDSRLIAYQESDTSQVEVLHLADPMHPEREPNAWPYPRPGKANAEVRLGVVPAAGGAAVWVDWDRARYPYLAGVTWDEGAPLTLLVQNREQTEELLLAVNPSDGRTRPLLRETDPSWLNLHAGVPRWLPGGHGFLWISERSGEPRLERREADGRSPRWVTPDGLGLAGLVGADAESAYVLASADPTEAQVWRVPLSGAAPTPLTRERGVHDAVFARDASAWVSVASSLSGERSWTVRGGDGKEIARLRSVAERPPFTPRLELTTVGPRAFRAGVLRPRQLEPGRRYPVLVSVYGGPTAQTVKATGAAYLLLQWFADQGFVVVTLDGRGTPGRGRAWEREIKGNLIDVALHDQVEGLRALGARYSEMDLSRVGIFGWSFGGYVSAMAAMRRPDVYHAAVAGAPVCDWQDYDTHYTERYLGLPDGNPEGYRKSSVLTYAPDLRVPLLVVHGTADDNVYFLHSLKLTDALFRAGKRYEFLALSGLTHMVPDAGVTRSLQGRIADFFVEHLKP